MSDRYELHEKIDNAVEALQEAHDLIQDVAEEVGESAQYEAYIVSRLEIIMSENHGYCASDLNLDNLRESVDNYFEEQDENV